MADLTILTVGIEKHYGYIRRQLQMIDVRPRGEKHGWSKRAAVPARMRFWWTAII